MNFAHQNSGSTGFQFRQGGPGGIENVAWPHVAGTNHGAGKLGGPEPGQSRVLFRRLGDSGPGIIGEIH